MITAKILKDVMAEARPIIERQLDDAELIAGLRDCIAEHGGDWSSLKALIKAQIQDERDEAGDGKRVRKILDKADWSAAYADLLGLANMNEKNFSSLPPHDPETGEVIEEMPAGSPVAGHDPLAKAGEGASSLQAHECPTETPAKPVSPAAVASAAGPSTTEMEIPAFLRRTKPPPEATA